MTPVLDALAQVLDPIQPVSETEMVGLRSLAGRIPAVDIVARRTQPDFAASAMDGYAVRASDTQPPQALRVVGESAAGREFARVVGPRECVRIFTGAPLPDGADAVVLQEDADRSGDRMTPHDAVLPARHVRPRGNDFWSGQRLVAAGKPLRAASIALVASGGYSDACVYRRPRVGLLATGDELVQPGNPVGPHQIVASNTYAVAAIAEQAGAEVIDFGIAVDHPTRLHEALDRAFVSNLDILVTLGGASVGDHDLVAPALRASGVTLDFMKVAMRPGKPLMAGRRDQTLVLGLPGNPASSLVTAAVFLVPMVRRLHGETTSREWSTGRLAKPVAANDGRTEFLRSRVHSTIAGWLVDPLPRQDSSLLSIFAEADGLLVRPAHAPREAAGARCQFIPL